MLLSLQLLIKRESETFPSFRPPAYFHTMSLSHCRKQTCCVLPRVEHQRITVQSCLTFKTKQKKKKTLNSSYNVRVIMAVKHHRHVTVLMSVFVFSSQVPENIHIRLLPIADIQGNQTLKFINSQSKYKMSLDDKNDDEIIISCTGPYILYMDVCYLSMLEGKEVNGTLWLLDERKTPEILFSMSSSHEVCTALHKTVYFRKTGKASLQLISTTNFKIKTVTVGMSSQLGGQCLY
ncbi:uncharacterized protein LOC115591934 isoform X1 [Sparus aurata]|uniref:uncharacterized protein LOC115591934 isoform X1 n=1 Tax=Sparus aurata TaxID=8175 RepID=UPI0011C1882A|nr:uncharacterized protein LOC115591934 isoform X1 [Sparus aurata]